MAEITYSQAATIMDQSLLSTLCVFCGKVWLPTWSILKGHEEQDKIVYRLASERLRTGEVKLSQLSPADLRDWEGDSKIDLGAMHIVRKLRNGMQPRHPSLGRVFSSGFLRSGRLLMWRESNSFSFRDRKCRYHPMIFGRSPASHTNGMSSITTCTAQILEEQRSSIQGRNEKRSTWQLLFFI